MTEKEMEIKLDLVNEQFFNRLLDYLQDPEELRRQTNYFFDTENHDLACSGWALRFRTYGDRAIITAKGIVSGNIDGLTVRPEIEELIEIEKLREALENGIDIKELPEKISRIFVETGIRGIVRKLLSFTTERHIFAYSFNNLQIEFELDRTEYSDGSVDYELEVEIDDISLFETALREVERILERLKIPCNYQSESKFGRALKKIGIDTGPAE